MLLPPRWTKLHWRSCLRLVAPRTRAVARYVAGHTVARVGVAGTNLTVACLSLSQLLATGNNAEAAGGWLMDHMGDADINDPIAAPAPAGGAEPQADPANVAMLTAMLGISERHAAKALNSTGGSLERAADWALSHPDVPDEPAAATADEDSKTPEYKGKYKLKAVISHIGTTTTGGHYVCHVLKDGVWAFFNDASVAQSEVPPLKHGFMYLYECVE